MNKLMAFGEQYGRPMNPREAGVLLLNEDREAAWRTVAPLLQGLPMQELSSQVEVPGTNVRSGTNSTRVVVSHTAFDPIS